MSLLLLFFCIKILSCSPMYFWCLLLYSQDPPKDTLLRLMGSLSLTLLVFQSIQPIESLQSSNTFLIWHLYCVSVSNYLFSIRLLHVSLSFNCFYFLNVSVNVNIVEFSISTRTLFIFGGSIMLLKLLKSIR